jgi:hypothetical protein
MASSSCRLTSISTRTNLSAAARRLNLPVKRRVRARVSHCPVVENLASRARRAGDKRGGKHRGYAWPRLLHAFSRVPRIISPSNVRGLRGSLIAKGPRRLSVRAASPAEPIVARVSGQRSSALRLSSAALVWRSRPNRALKWDAPAIAL